MNALTRRQFLRATVTGAALSVCGCAPGTATGAVSSGKRPCNVLFIAVDDLRPELGCYGNKAIKTPHLDRLAEQGTVFNRAYCQQAVCSPSRTSLLTGRRPDTTRVYDLETHFRTTIPDVVTLPEYFKQNGFHCQGLSKIYHGGLDDAQSWSVPWWRPTAAAYHTERGLQALEDLREESEKAARKPPEKGFRGLPYEAPDVPDSALADGETTDHAIEVLREVKDKPFFLAVGYLKPHLPFVAPKKYWGLYRKEDLTLADNPFAPKDAPEYALSNWGELRAYVGMPKTGPVSDEQALELIHGYYACTSFVDAQVGRLLDELDRLGLRESTAIVLWGDHGWQLGEHGMWCKHTNFETSVHSLLLASVPGQRGAGEHTDALVEFVDVYPTLCDVCELPLPEGLEGTSFAPLLDQPRRRWKPAAYSQYPRTVGKERVMGYSMRTDRYRLTEWRWMNGDKREFELYDHDRDPEENVNIANQPENRSLVERLTVQLDAVVDAGLARNQHA